MKRNDQRQALGDKKVLEQLAQSADAQALAGMISRGQDTASLQRIAEKAAKGDTAELKGLIQSITSTPGGAEILQRLGDSFNKK